jgi:hypothetical protein
MAINSKMGPDKMIREEGYDMCFKRLVFFV